MISFLMEQWPSCPISSGVYDLGSQPLETLSPKQNCWIPYWIGIALPCCFGESLHQACRGVGAVLHGRGLQSCVICKTECAIQDFWLFYGSLGKDCKVISPYSIITVKWPLISHWKFIPWSYIFLWVIFTTAP